MFIFAQFIGILASTLNIGKYFVREEKSSLIMILGTYFFIGVTLLLLNAYTGAICYMLIGTLVMCEYMYKIKNEKIIEKYEKRIKRKIYKFRKKK